MIDTTRHRIIANYYSDKGEDRTKPGPDYDQSTLVHLVVPADVLGTPFLSVVYEQGAYRFQEDAAAKAQAVTDQWNYLREIRNKKLAECDWRLMVTDVPLLSAEQREAWMLYRQALRDLPSNTVDPSAVVWPIAPM